MRCSCEHESDQKPTQIWSIGEHELHTFEVVIIVLLFKILVPANAYPISFMTAVCPNILECQINMPLGMWP